MMKEDLRVWRESLTETTVVTKKEFLLITAVCILGGIVIGMMFSPRKYVMIGSKNGNGSCNNSGNDNERRINGKEKAVCSNRRKNG